MLGLDFLSHSNMVMDLEIRQYYFRFAPHQPLKFESLVENEIKKVSGQIVISDSLQRVLERLYHYHLLSWN
jgi:hypothetical protein